MQETIKKVLILLFLLLGLVYTILMSSCGSRRGYGCDGKSSWESTQKRANRMY